MSAMGAAIPLSYGLSTKWGKVIIPAKRGSEGGGGCDAAAVRTQERRRLTRRPEPAGGHQRCGQPGISVAPGLGEDLLTEAAVHL